MIEENNINKDIFEKINWIYQDSTEMEEYATKNFELIWDDNSNEIYLNEIRSLHEELKNECNNIADISKDYADKEVFLLELIEKIKIATNKWINSTFADVNKLKNDYSLKLTWLSSSLWISDEKMTWKLNDIEKTYKKWVFDIYSKYLKLIKWIIKLSRQSINLIVDETKDEEKMIIEKEKNAYEAIVKINASNQ